MPQIQMDVHRLKVWPAFFDVIAERKKTFEVRKADRDFKCCDILVLQEWSPQTKAYTGREVRRVVRYILNGGQFGIEEGYVVMAIA